MKSLNTTKLLYLEGYGNYSKIYYQFRPYPEVECYTLGRFETHLPDFIRVHKHALVNPSHVRSYSKKQRLVELTSGQSIAISRRQLAHFIDRYTQFKQAHS